MIGRGKQDRAKDGSSSSVSPWSPYGSIGSIVRSRDFEIGIPLGIAIGAIPAFSNAAANGAVTILITFAAILGAIMAVVLAGVTLFATFITPDYRQVLGRGRGGVQGALRPYFAVVVVSATGLVASLVAAVGWPALPDHASWLRWLTFSVPACLTMWAIIGTVQLVGLSNLHIKNRADLIGYLEEIRKRRSA